MRQTLKGPLCKPLRYDSTADIVKRLTHTFVRYDGEVIYCGNALGVDSDLRLEAYPMLQPGWSYDINTGEVSSIWEINANDSHLDLESPELGWANITVRGSHIRPCFFMRTINRQWQQGVNPNRCLFLDPSSTNDMTSGWRWGTLNDLVPFAQMIAGVNYPTFIKALETERVGAAVSKHWAVTPIKGEKATFQVYHDGNAVALFNVSTGMFFFARGQLTKTRRLSLETLLENNKGTNYGISEQQDQPGY